MAGFKSKIDYETLRANFDKKKGLPQIKLGHPDGPKAGDFAQSPPGKAEDLPVISAPEPLPAPKAEAVSESEPESPPAGVTVKIHLAPPVPGVFPFFDTVAKATGERKAMLALLRKAFDHYQAALLDGAVVPAGDYDTQKRAFSTGRKMHPAALRIAKAQLDPYDLETPTGLGKKIAMTALASYMATTAPGT